MESESEHAASGLILAREVVGGFFEEFLESQERGVDSIKDFALVSLVSPPRTCLGPKESFSLSPKVE